MPQPGLDVDRLFERYGPMVVRRCRELLGDREEARDAAQDVFVQLLRHRRRLDDR
ncbi:MAG: sigma-70 family RNA polymerase sigma factor, partial [Acidobacteria bacterium]|nr:sigma-70 family RNA polymerase sigma factor [Acidobacteriota bacterium]